MINYYQWYELLICVIRISVKQTNIIQQVSRRFFGRKLKTHEAKYQIHSFHISHHDFSLVCFNDQNHKQKLVVHPRSLT